MAWPLIARAGVELLIAMLLLYSFLVVPIQLSFWVSDDVCSLPPTQHFDMTAEMIFIVCGVRVGGGPDWEGRN